MNSDLASLGPPLANHLWQSTAFGLLAWVVTLALRRNRARVRYAVWLAASIKFLIPFSLLVASGNLLPHPRQAVEPMVYSTMDIVEEPFAATDFAPIGSQAYVPTLRERAEADLPTALAALWLIGVCTVLFGWWNRWRIVSRSARSAAATTEGREVQILRRLEAGAHPLPLFISAERMEPGIFGAFHPILVWPQQLSAHLDDQHIEAILAHELMHVRRRDNLAALRHMVVEATFWFHPLVWWTEWQMVKEREQACDEAVVEMGGSAETYAESLLKTCWFCVESPLPCVAGVTGADLKRRVADIITGRALLRMTWAKKGLIATAAVCVVTAPLMLGIVKMIPLYGQILHADGPMPSFEVATIRPMEHMLPPPPPGGGPPRTMSPNGEPIVARQEIRINSAPPFTDRVNRTTTARNLIADAYRLPAFSKAQIVGGPDWAEQTVYQISAKIGDSQYAEMQKMPSEKRAEQVRLMEQSLLGDRFRLKIHFETRELPVYALEVAKGGPKLAPTKTESAPDAPQGQLATISATSKGDEFEIKGKAASPAQLILFFQQQPELGNRLVIDKTGLTAKYDMVLDWRREGPATANVGSAAVDSGPSFFTALKEQLGLELVETKGPAEVIVIDHIEQPTVDGAETQQPSARMVSVAQAEPRTESAIPEEGGASPEPPKFDAFDVASIRPVEVGPKASRVFKMDGTHRWSATNYTLEALIALGYDLNPRTIYGGPEWVRTQNFVIEAVTPGEVSPTRLEQMQMLRALLVERFGLKFHRQDRKMEIYELTLAKSGSKLKSAVNPNDPPKIVGIVYPTRIEVPARSVTMDDFVAMLQRATLDRPTVNKTGLTGKYDFTLDFAQDDSQYGGQVPIAPDNSQSPPLFTAVQEQLGLKLAATHGTVSTLVIDSVNKPSAD